MKCFGVYCSQVYWSQVGDLRHQESAVLDFLPTSKVSKTFDVLPDKISSLY